jgi:hypothetical protein
MTRLDAAPYPLVGGDANRPAAAGNPGSRAAAPDAQRRVVARDGWTIRRKWSK